MVEMLWETGKGHNKTVQVSGLLNVRSSRAFQERSNAVLVFPPPFRDQETSGDSYPGLEVPSTAPCRSVFVPHAVFDRQSRLLPFMKSSWGSKPPLCFELLISFFFFKEIKGSCEVVSSGSSSPLLCYNHDLLGSSCGFIWEKKKKKNLAFVLLRSDKERKGTVASVVTNCCD